MDSRVSFVNKGPVTKKHCCYGVCNSDSRYMDREHMQGVFFIPFPKPKSNENKCKRWIAACGRENFTVDKIKKWTYICSKHFVGGKGPTETHPDPVPATFTPAQLQRNSRKMKAPTPRAQPVSKRAMFEASEALVRLQDVHENGQMSGTVTANHNCSKTDENYIIQSVSATVEVLRSMDQDMEADDFFPDKLMSETVAMTAGGDASAPNRSGDSQLKALQGESVVDEMMNGGGEAEAMETDEPLAPQEETNMAEAADYDESSSVMEETSKESKTEEQTKADSELPEFEENNFEDAQIETSKQETEAGASDDTYIEAGNEKNNEDSNLDLAVDLQNTEDKYGTAEENCEEVENEGNEESNLDLATGLQDSGDKFGTFGEESLNNANDGESGVEESIYKAQNQQEDLINNEGFDNKVNENAENDVNFDRKDEDDVLNLEEPLGGSESTDQPEEATKKTETSQESEELIQKRDEIEAPEQQDVEDESRKQENAVTEITDKEYGETKKLVDQENAESERSDLQSTETEENGGESAEAKEPNQENTETGDEDWKILEDSQTSIGLGEDSTTVDNDIDDSANNEEIQGNDNVGEDSQATDNQVERIELDESGDQESGTGNNKEIEETTGKQAEQSDQAESASDDKEIDITAGEEINEEELLGTADEDKEQVGGVKSVPDDVQAMQTEDYGLETRADTDKQVSVLEAEKLGEEKSVQLEDDAACSSSAKDVSDRNITDKENDREEPVEDTDKEDVGTEKSAKNTDQASEEVESTSVSQSETTPTPMEVSQSEPSVKDCADRSQTSQEPPSESEMTASNQSEATPSTEKADQSEESSSRQSGSPSSMTGIKIKQERMDSCDEEKTNDSTSGGSHLKIVGVTSAVGVEDKLDNCNETNSTEGQSSTDTASREDMKNERVKVKQEKAAAGSQKEEAKKNVKEELKKKVKAETKAGEDNDDDVIAIKEEKKPVPKPKPSKIQTCIVCGKVGKCKYNIVRNGDVKHLCDDTCFKKFRSSPTTYLKQAEASAQNQAKQEKPAGNKTLPSTPATPTIANTQPNQQSAFQSAQVYKTCTVCQLMNVRTSKPFLNWQGLDFCGEECLGKYQGSLSNNCSYCAGAIFPNNKAKFCCRVGNEVKHFCSANCNTDFVKRMKVCSFCNKDLAQSKDSFMAPVGETFKDFCSQTCLQKFEDKNNKDLEIVGIQKGQKAANVPKGNFQCAVCSKIGPVKHEFKLDSKVNRLCSDPCFSAFQYANKLTLNTCDNCGTNLNSENQAPQYVQFEGQQKRFCSFMCVNTFRNTNKKTVPCAWCGNKKSNFDMIERVDANNKYQLFCSLNCLSLYRVNLQATSNQAVTCDQCRKFVPAQYHLTMSDASVRNFCSYGCVMQFQAQFQTPAKQVGQQNNAAVGAKPPSQPPPQTTTRSGRVVTKASKVVAAQQPAGRGRGTRKDADSFPIISNVVSLAPQGTQQQINIKSSTPVTVTNQQQGIKATTTTTGNQTVQQQIIIQPPPPKIVKNKSLLCKPFTQTKATSCRPHTQSKEVQTEGKSTPDKYLIPVPVPLYCPTPLAMYSLPTPILIPIPVPIPVPVFIPTTKKSANSILKQIKEIREKIPADPLEAELLMMAEAVAGKEDESSSSSSEEEDTIPEPVMRDVAPSIVASAASTGVTASASSADLGEDMLQMALRMATEMSEEPVMDLETSLEPVAVNTEPPAPARQMPSTPPIEDEEEYLPTSARARRARGGKRSSRSTPRRNPKRAKMDSTPTYHEATPSPPAPAAPPPDANFHLKYTYGVNAFKHWVIQKNAQLEQAAKPGQGKNLKTFKTDILQCTADELNFSLCLFVKEVRKPNGEEYAVDSIYYLCLGIQQYLFENGRIDNIFTDFYYEKFTEGLNEILTRYEPKLNHAGQLVCRIEEEHLWESKQLGAHSPHVLLNSLVYFNTKYFMLKTSEDHLKLSFTHIMKHWKKTATGRGSGTGPNAGRSVYLRYYCPTPQGKDNQKKKKEEMPVYEQTENLDNPLRCPVKLYEFYLSKCPESIKNRNDTFYLVPERSCVPDSPVWYSTGTLGIDHMAKMLNRIRLVREIQEAHLHTQPIYI